MKSSRIIVLWAGLALILALFWYVQTTLQRGPVEKALISAVKQGNLSMVRLLLQRGADPNTKDEAGIGLATWGLVNGQPEAARLLLDKGADVDARFCLLDAASKGEWVGVTLLIERRAHVNVRDEQGRTPLLLALAGTGEGAFDQTAWTLLEGGADVRARDSRGHTALLLAVQRPFWSEDLLKTLLEKGADVNARGADGRTALMDVARQVQDTDAHILQALIARGADVNARSADGTTPLMEAAGMESVLRLRLLLRAGAKVPAPDTRGRRY